MKGKRICLVRQFKVLQILTNELPSILYIEFTMIGTVSYNHRMACIVRDPKDHQVSNPLPQEESVDQVVDQTAQGPMQPDLLIF